MTPDPFAQPEPDSAAIERWLRAAFAKHGGPRSLESETVLRAVELRLAAAPEERGPAAPDQPPEPLGSGINSDGAKR